ncbi:hypothetical protein MMC13_002104 [Lambiella insularis]|nr:hypothetical protein [Lambiella insularis]
MLNWTLPAAPGKGVAPVNCSPGAELEAEAPVAAAALAATETGTLTVEPAGTGASEKVGRGIISMVVGAVAMTVVLALVGPTMTRDGSDAVLLLYKVTVTCVVEVNVVVVVGSFVAAASVELARVATTVLSRVAKEIRVCVVVRDVAGVTEVRVPLDGGGMTDELDDTRAATVELTGRGLIVSVIGVTPPDDAGVAILCPVPIENGKMTLVAAELPAPEDAVGGKGNGKLDD